MYKVFMLLFSIGVILIILDDLVIIGKEISFKIGNTFGKNADSKIRRHLEKYFKVVVKDEKVDGYIKCFFAATGGIFVVLSILFFSVLRIKGIVAALMFSILPYIILRLKVLNFQKQGSFEGEFLIREIRSQYKMNEKNLYVAIDNTVASIGEKIPFSKKALLRLSLKLKTFNNSTELMEILEEFTFAYNTEWANLLSQNVYSFAFEGADISAGLDDMLSICKRINTTREKRKKANTQSSAMTKILAPLFFVGFFVMLCTMLNVRDVIYFQFHTSGGLLVFIICVTLLIANLIAASLVKNQKYDI